MAENTEISWADDTFNPWIGCAKVSPACDGCYAEALMGVGGRFERVHWGKPGSGEGTRVRTAPSNWSKPLKWDKEQATAEAAALDVGAPLPPPRFVFCASLADVFDNAVPPEWRRDLFDLIRATPHLTWLLLTKRPGNIVKLFFETLDEDQHPDWMVHPHTLWPRNAAIGFTAVTQPEMDRDSRQALAAFRALNPAFLFWSGEPLLGGVVIPDELLGLGGRFWAITGGETDQGKHKARPSNPAWFRSIRDQCAAAGVAYHHKQNGEWAPSMERGTRKELERMQAAPTGRWHAEFDVFRVGKKAAGRLLDGVEHNARPTPR